MEKWKMEGGWKRRDLVHQILGIITFIDFRSNTIGLTALGRKRQHTICYWR